MIENTMRDHIHMAELPETLELLRRVLAAIDAGEIDADAGQRTYLSGAVEILGSLVDRSGQRRA